LFVSLPNGIEELMTALVSCVAETTAIRLQTAVRGVRRRSEERFEIVVERSEEPRTETDDRNTGPLHFDAVILAVPAFIAARLLGDGPPELSAELNRIEFASTAVVASGHSLANIAHPLDAFGLVVPSIEKRQVLAVSFTSRKFPGRAPAGCALLRTFVGGALQPELFDLDDRALLELVRRELSELLGVRDEPDFAVVLRHERAMPQYHVGHLDVVSRIESALSACPGLALAGNFLKGVGIPDSIASGEAAAEKVLNELSRRC